MQRLVAIDLGNRDVVLELARHRLVQLVQHAQRCVAVGDRGHDQPEAVNIGDLGEAQVLDVHFAVNGIQRLLAPGNADLDVGGSKRGLHFQQHLLQQITPSAPCPRHCLA